MEILLVFGYAFLFYYIIVRWKFFSIDSLPFRWAGIIFLFKCIAGILLGLLYTKYYKNHSDADTFKFWGDSKIIFDAVLDKPYDFFRMFTGINARDNDLLPYYLKMDAWLNNSPLYNDNKTIIRLNALFRFFSLGYYNVHVVFINFISFTGIFCLYKTFVHYVSDKKKELFLLIFLMPSLLFWGSGLLKDGLLIAGYGILIYSFSLLMRKGYSLKRFIIFIVSLAVLMFIKIYVFALIIPGLFAWFITKKKSSRTVILTFIGIYAIYFIAAFNLYHFNDDYNVAALLFYKQKNFLEIANDHSATMISYPHFECSGPSIMFNSPYAFCNTFFRPFLWDVHGNPMVLLSAFENILILIIVFLCVISFKTKDKKTEPIIMLSAIFVITLFSLIGLITPVLGAIVRYKIIALPCMMFVLVYYYDKEKLINLFKKFR